MLGPSGEVPASNRYGMSIAFDGHNVIVGAPDYKYPEPVLNGSGAVYFLDLDGPD